MRAVQYLLEHGPSLLVVVVIAAAVVMSLVLDSQEFPSSQERLLADAAVNKA